MIKNYLLIESDSKLKEDKHKNGIWVYKPNIFDLCRKFKW